MRILHVIPYMNPDAGGPPVVVENFVREASKAGHFSEIISTPLFCKGDEDALLRRLRDSGSITFISRFGVFAPLDGAVRHLIGKSIAAADIVHIHTLWSPLNAMIRIECVRSCRPYVLMPHGMLDPYSLSVKRWRKALYLWAVERKNIYAADRLIYTTEEEASLAATQFAALPKGAVVPLGGDAPIENSFSLAAGFLERFPKALGRRQILFLGRLHFKKGLDRIITILPTVVDVYPEVLLTLVGSGTPNFEEELKYAIAKQGLENHVMMTGRLSGAAKWGAYASAELFLLPSRQENFAITVAEAMHMGVPVIISKKVNAWPYVRDAGAGFVLSNEQIVGDLKDRVLWMLLNSKARAEMGSRGQEYARKNLTWQRAATNLLKCYDDVISAVRT